jgi:RNA recognition motif-containing protein
MTSSNSVSTCSTASLSTTSAPSKKIFLNISPSTSKVDLHDFLARKEVGQVEEIYIPQDENFNSRGFAFVTFQSHEDATAAMTILDGEGFDGIILHPGWAKERKQQDANSKRNYLHGEQAKSKKSKAVSQDMATDLTQSALIPVYDGWYESPMFYEEEEYEQEYDGWYEPPLFFQELGYDGWYEDPWLSQEQRYDGPVFSKEHEAVPEPSAFVKGKNGWYWSTLNPRAPCFTPGPAACSNGEEET